MERGAGITELCAEHAALSRELANLDRRIQTLSGAPGEDTGCDAVALPVVDPSAEADLLWMQVNDIVARQIATVVALTDKIVSNATELRDKGQVLGALLRTNGQAENDFVQAFSLSLVRDIMTLFP